MTYVVLAVVFGLITIPAHAFGLRGDWPDVARTEQARHDTGPGGHRVVAVGRCGAGGAGRRLLGVFAVLATLAGSAALISMASGPARAP